MEFATDYRALSGGQEQDVRINLLQNDLSLRACRFSPFQYSMLSSLIDEHYFREEHVAQLTCVPCRHY